MGGPGEGERKTRPRCAGPTPLKRPWHDIAERAGLKPATCTSCARRVGRPERPSISPWPENAQRAVAIRIRTRNGCLTCVVRPDTREERMLSVCPTRPFIDERRQSHQ